jgi:hypothetical protein
MNAGQILSQVKVLCSEQQYTEARTLIEENQDILKDKYQVASDYIAFRQRSIANRLKTFYHNFVD